MVAGVIVPPVPGNRFVAYRKASRTTTASPMTSSMFRVLSGPSNIAMFSVLHGRSTAAASIDALMVRIQPDQLAVLDARQPVQRPSRSPARWTAAKEGRS